MLAVTALAFSEPHTPLLKRKHLGRAADMNPVALNGLASRLGKRAPDKRFSFYAAGLGACGHVNTDADFVSRETAQFPLPLLTVLSNVDRGDECRGKPVPRLQCAVS